MITRIVLGALLIQATPVIAQDAPIIAAAFQHVRRDFKDSGEIAIVRSERLKRVVIDETVLVDLVGAKVKNSDEMVQCVKTPPIGRHDCKMKNNTVGILGFFHLTRVDQNRATVIVFTQVPQSTLYAPTG